VSQPLAWTLVRIFLVLLMLAAGAFLVGIALLFGSDPLCD
jgi:hypothetical protein